MEDKLKLAILYDDEKRIFTLHTKNSTYQFQADTHGYLMHLYYGRKSNGLMNWTLSFYNRGFACSPYDAGNDRTYSLDYLPQEFPFQGSGDFRNPMLIVRDCNGTYDCDLRYKGYEIVNGKYSLSGLPASYSDSDDDQTLKIFLEDERLNIRITLLYGILYENDIITRSAVLRNNGHEDITIEKFQSACLDFTHGHFDIITFHGRHTLEMQPERHELNHVSHVIGSRRGTSSHQYNPFVILSDHETTETFGRCWGMQFVWSGGFNAEAELDQYNQTRIQMGLHEEKFSYPVRPDEEFTAPEVIMSFSSEGLNHLSQNFHKCIRNNICRGFWKNKPRPVLLNSWEASYFNFTGESLLSMARHAKDLNIDMFVLDDGWFINRSNDDRALGDWIPDEKKLGGSLSSLIEKINAMGLKFGIWVEPEMISENSNLYREHPDWALSIPGRSPVLGRNQLVLDMSRKEVRNYIFDSVCNIMNHGNIEYLKWDYNRSISDVFSHSTCNQGRVLYDYIIGLYEVLERIISRYPEVLIEGCSGGGGRFDAGMLYYTPQIWASDNTDAIDRAYIHYGISFGYPMSVSAAHVSVCPNHQTGRITPLKTRGIVSMTGSFGYELNPEKLGEDEKSEIREQIRKYKEDEDTIINGMYYRLSNPHSENLCAWEYVSCEGENVIVNAVIHENHGNPPVYYVTLQGLTHGALYVQKENGEVYASDALMDSGFPLPVPTGDYEAYSYHFRRV